MTPPRSPGLDGGDNEGAHAAAVEEIAALQGVINVAEARIVDVTRRALAQGVSGGDHLTPQKWVAWRAGVSPGRAADIVRLAERADDLPHTLAALRSGELSLDQAAEVARYVPSRYDESAARVARCCTVKQLRQALPWYRDPKPDKPKPDADHDPEVHGSISTGYDERGYYAHIRLPEATGAVVDQALKAMHEDLKRKAKAEAPDGAEPEPVYAADALVAMAEAALRAGEAARPGTDRYLVHAHLEAGPDGLQLMTHLGVVLPEGQRRHILCDARLRATVHDGTAPIGTGRTTRDISRRLRRAVEHRDGGCCAVPGCGRTTGLEIHHTWHWEDGGPTETWNLITLCRLHHTRHHQGTLGITGNADLPRHTPPGVVFTNQWGKPLDPVGQPKAPGRSATDTEPGPTVAGAARAVGITAEPYRCPTGARLDRSGFHLQEQPPGRDAGVDADADPAADDPPPPEASVSGHPPTSVRCPTGPDSRAVSDPTRAGPRSA